VVRQHRTANMMGVKGSIANGPQSLPQWQRSAESLASASKELQSAISSYLPCISRLRCSSMFPHSIVFQQCTLCTSHIPTSSLHLAPTMASDSARTLYPRGQLRELRQLHERAISNGPAFGLFRDCTETKDSMSWTVDGIVGWRIAASTLKWEYKIRWCDCFMDINDLATYLSSTVDDMPLALSVQTVTCGEQAAQICWKDTWLPGEGLACDLAIAAFWNMFDEDVRFVCISHPRVISRLTACSEGLEVPMAETVVLLKGKKRTWLSERQQLCDWRGEIIQAIARMSLELLW